MSAQRKKTVFQYSRIAAIHKSLGLLLLISCSLLAGIKSTLANAPVIVENGLLTVDLKKIPLHEALIAIGDQAGFGVIIYGDLDTSVTPRPLRNAPLIEGVRYLIGNNDMVIVHDGSDVRRIVEVRVYGRARPHTNASAQPVYSNDMQRASSAANDAQSDDLKALILAELEQAEPAFRIDALALASELDPVQAVMLLTQVLDQDLDADVRRYAIELLESIGGELGFNAIQTALGDNSPDIRLQTVESLSWIGGEQAVPVLGQALISDPDPLIRQAAIESIAAQPPSDAVLAYLKLAANDPDSGVRAFANANLALLN